jgi:hypothetical protein
MHVDSINHRWLLARQQKVMWTLSMQTNKRQVAPASRRCIRKLVIALLELNRSFKGLWRGHISSPCTHITSYARYLLLLLLVVPFNRLEAVIAVRMNARDRSAKRLPVGLQRRIRPARKVPRSPRDGLDCHLVVCRWRAPWPFPILDVCGPTPSGFWNILLKA